MIEVVELPHEIDLGSGNSITIERVAYRELPFRLTRTESGLETATVEFESGDNAREGLCAFASLSVLAIYLVELSKLLAFETNSLRPVFSQTLTRHSEGLGSLRRARFHALGQNTLFENEKNLIFVSPYGSSRLDLEYRYPESSVLEVTESEVIVDSGGEVHRLALDKSWPTDSPNLEAPPE